ncbi:hypothetical protein [Paenibacillus piscarius]|uniref:hypothetical protein n=1 Tax=Paenibacillus piscarius TaxID=1089681 RepID=UPI001EE7E3B9|nr:hypothetical protein [Paenibacillus piscarius]
MGHKQWTFTAPGNPAGTELVIDTSRITTVYDLLNRLRAEAQQQNPQVIPLSTRRERHRRHPSA